MISSHFAPVEQLHLVRELVEKLQEKPLRGRKTMVPCRLSFANSLNNVDNPKCEALLVRHACLYMRNINGYSTLPY